MLDSWGYSSVGRAPALQAGGQEFESPYLHLIIQEALNYHQYLENYTLKKIEDIDCQKTIKDINFTDLKNLFFRTRTKKYGYESNHAFISQEPCRCIIANALEQKVKRIRAQGGCLGTKSRRKT